MCWYCCISLRGAVYFGTSVHIFVGLVLLVRWIVVTYIAGFVTEKLLSDASVLILTVLSGVYILLFLILGCIIFAGTERQSVSVLKWSAAGFSMLQILVFTVILILYLVAPGGWAILEPDITTEMRLLLITMYFCSLVATINYLIVLFLYIRKLWNLKRRRSTSSSATVRISHPIPQQQTTTAANNATANYTVSYHRNPRSHPGGVGGPESPGIYESLDTHSISSHQPHPFYPANFYSSYSNRGTAANNEGLYNGSVGQGSIRSVGGTYYPQRPYPYPHQRYREPLVPSAREEDELLDQYGHRLQMFQRGQHERNSATAQPLLRHNPNY